MQHARPLHARVARRVRAPGPCLASVVAGLALTAFVGTASAAAISLSSVAADAAGLLPTVDAYRALVGGGSVAGAAGSFGGLRREINWDGVPDGSADPNPLALDFFNVASPRGVVFSTPGTGVAVSANAGQIEPTLFSYPNDFRTFSAERLFAAVGSTVVDVSFFVPGTTTQALTRGFGSVFTDVEAPDVTSIEYFDAIGGSLGRWYVPIGANRSLSFLGVLFDTAVVSRVRITAGDAPLGDGLVERGDLVAMDDFIYAEPLARASTVDAPATLPLLAAGLLGVALFGRRARGRG